jgi:perosamine synthetase
MTDLQGAVGLIQLGKLDRFIAERAQWADFYSRELDSIDWLRAPVVPQDGQHAWQAYVLYVDPAKAPTSRNDIMERLQTLGVSTRPGTHAVHMLGYYAQRYQLHPDDFPAARDCNDNTMAIPLHNRMTDADYAYVVDALRQIA